ncbi:P-type conjugative transfer ATPase TrbB [Rhizobium sp. AQ_MP]|jgi:type IV secretion system protein VirB11|uniref:P-type conjugative transfer ATPase TrbB n=1 Tax=Rhizobium sp. AQ_MP TaxID=2761536 RepID=UPI00163B2C02|nr:P-type conjugative transfer ATPase TrbB [Rhizobium sp. AQ_MP]MBC2774958.1 P-type conjugative transfer ATPase TrbB [Rhizobium sp. AQ_MP]
MSELVSRTRLNRKLEEALGADLCQRLVDPDVIEVMLNPDGTLFIERLTGGMENIGSLEPARAEVLIGLVAHALGQEVNNRMPIVSGEIPLGRHRFEGLLPPAVSAPTFSIRRRAINRIPLEDYVKQETMSPDQFDRLQRAIKARQNILVCGGTGSGKTTLANAVLQEIHKHFPDDRIVLIEDTLEIDCPAKNAVTLRSSNSLAIERLLKSTLRLRPDRIMVGEVRDGAALTLLKAWNTGHPGGFTTLHANDAPGALRRLEQLVCEVSQMPMQHVIADAIDLIVSIKRSNGKRRIDEVVGVEGFDEGRYLLV